MRTILVAVLAAVVLAACGNNPRKPPRPIPKATGSRCFVSTGAKRCVTCTAIENGAKEVAETCFAGQIEAGDMSFRIIDITQPENAALAEKYEIAWSSILLVRRRDGRETVNDLTQFAFANARTNPDKFKAELKTAIENYCGITLWSICRTCSTASTVPVVTAFLLGLLTAISPCPLAANITAIGYIGRDITDRSRIFRDGLLYALGRIAAYTLLGAVLIAVLREGASRFALQKAISRYGEMLLAPALILIGLFMLFRAQTQPAAVRVFGRRQNRETRRLGERCCWASCSRWHSAPPAGFSTSGC